MFVFRFRFLHLHFIWNSILYFRLRFFLTLEIPVLNILQFQKIDVFVSKILKAAF